MAQTGPVNCVFCIRIQVGLKESLWWPKEWRVRKQENRPRLREFTGKIALAERKLAEPAFKCRFGE